MWTIEETEWHDWDVRLDGYLQFSANDPMEAAGYIIEHAQLVVRTNDL